MQSTDREPLPATMPDELDRWNWGAFLLNWIWGIGNNTFIALLTFVPLLGLIMPFVLGAKGSAWAWRNGRWDSVEHFRRVQRRWAIWGFVVLIAGIGLFGTIFGGLFYALRTSEAYRLGVEQIERSRAAAVLLGTPIATGFPTGSISTSGPSGEAVLDFAVTGPKAAGRAALRAVKRGGDWSLTALMLRVDGREEAIDLLKDDRAALDFRDRAS